MTVFRRERHVVPRWRPLGVAVQSRELARPQAVPPQAALDPELTARLEAWRHARDLVTASEVLETAIVTGKEHEAVRAARLISDAATGATPLVKRQAELVLRRTGHLSNDPGDELPDLHATRVRTREFGDDPLAWADLALGYVIAGKQEAAERAMRVALQLAPHDRLILRAAARLYLHLNDAERAHDLLRRNEATRRDPWLMAGEAALPFHLSELASAIGTVHLRDGSRRARRMFERSLVDPTGNSLAQAEWASPLIGNIVAPRAAERVRDSSEARAFHAYWAGNFDRVLQESERWMVEEPYSTRPYVSASAAAIALDRPQVARAHSEKGLARDPDSPILHNHLAYALVELELFQDASRVIQHALSQRPGGVYVGSLIATAGMLAIRQGMLKEGERLYGQAIAFFKKSGNQPLEALASAYLAREMSRAGASNASALLGEAERLCKDLRFLPEAKVVIDRARHWQGAVRHRNELMLAVPKTFMPEKAGALLGAGLTIAESITKKV
jgi:tetratricopeptide (TPR) repeat protein